MAKRVVSGCVLTLVLVDILLNGCGLVRRPTYSYTAAIAADRPPAEVLSELQREYNTSISSCEKLISGLDRRGEGLSWTLIGLGIFGAMLGGTGSVLLGASQANATLAAAFSSGAGIAAGVQPFFVEQGQSPEQLRTIRNTIAKNVRAAMIEWGGIPLTGDREEIRRRRIVIEQIAGYCRFFSLSPD